MLRNQKIFDDYCKKIREALGKKKLLDLDQKSTKQLEYRLLVLVHLNQGDISKISLKNIRSEYWKITERNCFQIESQDFHENYCHDIS